MWRTAKVLQYVFGVSAVAAAMVAAAVMANQIRDDGKFTWGWAYPAFAFTLLGLLLTTALEYTRNLDNPASGRRRGSQRRYRQQVRASVEQMETLGLVTQAEYVLRTRQVYVDVALQPQTVTNTTGDAGIGLVPPEAAQAVGERAPLASFLARRRVLAVLGAAGTGKTTLARYTALDLAERDWRPWQARFWRRPLPVLLYLRDHAEAILAEPDENGLNVGLARVAATAPWLNDAIDSAWLERQLDKGRCVVLLDGLDEVADGEDRKRVVRWVDNQISRYPHNAFVITSRPHGYKDNRLGAADVLQIQRFTPDQIRAFLHAWYQAIERRARQGNRAETDRVAAVSAKDLFGRINALPALYDLAANPLLLTMIANVHRYRGQLPEGRAALYAEMCQVLLHRRQEVKGVTGLVDNVLRSPQKERIVQEIAWYMMCNNKLDISVADATRIIRTILGRIAPSLPAEAFLDYARRSGLLIEHRHGHYGFAHLTLQEYLAAAFVPGHYRRGQHLAKATTVNDPWWRETILLWAAGADVSPVVSICLAESTVVSLDLAYACAEQGLDLNDSLRIQLNELLESIPTDQEQLRLLDSVAVARDLHEAHLLAATRICAHPIRASLWNRYASRVGRPPLPSGTQAATGLWPTDVHGFLNWINNLFADGAVYRLPTSSEASQALPLYPAIGSMWAFTDGQSALVSPDGAPCCPTTAQINAYPNLILDHAHLLFRLLFPRSRLSFTQLLAYTLPRDLTRPSHRLLHTFDLICALRTARSLDLARDLSLDLAHGLAQDLRLDLTYDLDLDLGLALGLARDLARDLARNRTHTLDRAHNLARDLGRPGELDLNLARALALDPDLELDRTRDLARALDRTRNLARALDHNRPHDLNLDLDRALGRALGRASDLARDLGLARELNRALDRARELDRARNLALARTLSLDRARSPDSDLALALDLAFARAVTSQDLGRFKEIPVAVDVSQVCLALLRVARTSQARRGWRSRQGREDPSLSRFLATAVVQFSNRHTDDLENALLQAKDLASECGASRISKSIDEARTLAAPLWDRSRPPRQSDAVLAAIFLLSVLTSRERENLDSRLFDLVGQALTTLIALTPGTRTRGEIVQDGLVFLVRE